MKGKEVRPTEAKSHDVDLSQFDFSERFDNRLALSKQLKDQLNREGLDWRFINATSFRRNGNMAKFYWRPYKVETQVPEAYGLNSEGYVQREDLILAVRPKAASQAHKKYLAERRQLYKNINKQHADELRSSAKAAGANVKILEGYED